MTEKTTLFSMYTALKPKDVQNIMSERNKLKKLEECFSSEDVKERREATKKWDDAQPAYFAQVIKPLCARFQIETTRAQALVAYVFYSLYKLREIVTKTDALTAKELYKQEKDARHHWICSNYYSKEQTNNALNARETLDNFEIYLKVKYKLNVPNDWTGLLSEDLEAA